jgi:opacity protein-like surface antigen
MQTRAKTFQVAVVSLVALLPACAVAEGIDTEHIFAFMIGADVGTFGEREFQTESTGRFGRSGGTYRALSQEFELEFVPARNFRVEVGSTFASHYISGVPGLDDQRRLSWQGASIDLRYRFLNRETAPFGLTFATELRGHRVDETTAEAVRSFGTEFRLAFDRELVPDRIIAAFNLFYEPEWTRTVGSGVTERDSTLGAALGILARVRPGLLLGGEARYLRRYEGIGLEELAGQALFVGPTAYFQLSKRSRLTASYSIQAWGRPAGAIASLDPVNFDRHQARLVFGINF